MPDSMQHTNLTILYLVVTASFAAPTNPPSFLGIYIKIFSDVVNNPVSPFSFRSMGVAFET